MAGNPSKPVLRFQKQGRSPLAEERWADCSPLAWMRERRLQRRVGFVHEDRHFTTLGQLARYLAQQHDPPVSPSTVWNWLHRYDEAVREGRDPLAALCDRRRSDAGRSRFFDRHPQAAAFVQRRAAVKGTHGRQIHRELLRQWPTLSSQAALTGPVKPPSYWTLLQHLKALKRERRAARRARGAA